MSNASNQDVNAGYYRSANELGRLRHPPYDRPATERAFEQLVESFDPAWINDAAHGSPAAPMFICGMFRSGSTLVEQMLSGHPSITTGGELDSFPRLVAGRLPEFPKSVRSASRETLRQLGDDYLAGLRATFPHSSNVTDKRPDNFLYLGSRHCFRPRASSIQSATRRTIACPSGFSTSASSAMPPISRIPRTITCCTNA